MVYPIILPFLDPPALRLLEASALWGLIQHPALEADGVGDQKLQVLLPHRELEAVVPESLQNPCFIIILGSLKFHQYQ